MERRKFLSIGPGLIGVGRASTIVSARTDRSSLRQTILNWEDQHGEIVDRWVERMNRGDILNGRTSSSLSSPMHLNKVKRESDYDTTSSFLDNNIMLSMGLEFEDGSLKNLHVYYNKERTYTVASDGTIAVREVNRGRDHQHASMTSGRVPEIDLPRLSSSTSTDMTGMESYFDDLKFSELSFELVGDDPIIKTRNICQVLRRL